MLLINNSILQYYHGMLIEGVLLFYHTIEIQYANTSEGGGGLNCEAKVQVLIVTLPLPLLSGNRSQKGGGVTAGQYATKKREGAGRVRALDND